MKLAYMKGNSISYFHIIKETRAFYIIASKRVKKTNVLKVIEGGVVNGFYLVNEHTKNILNTIR